MIMIMMITARFPFQFQEKPEKNGKKIPSRWSFN